MYFYLKHLFNVLKMGLWNSIACHLVQAFGLYFSKQFI